MKEEKKKGSLIVVMVIVCCSILFIQEMIFAINPDFYKYRRIIEFIGGALMVIINAVWYSVWKFDND